MKNAFGWAILALVAVAPLPALAQTYVVPGPVYYAPPAPVIVPRVSYYAGPAPVYYSTPPTTTYYYSTPTTTYYSDPAPAYYSAPTTTTYYSSPAPVVYSPTYYAAPVWTAPGAVTTYRYGPLGRRIYGTTTYYPGGVVAYYP